MTCIVAISTREGLVVGADRLATSTKDGTPIEEAPKLVPLTRGVLAVSGNIGFGTNPLANNLFDATAIMRRHLENRDLEAVDWDGARTVLADPFYAVLSRMALSDRPCAKPEGWSSLQAVTFFRDSRGELQAPLVLVRLAVAEPVDVAVWRTHILPRLFATATPIVTASHEVWEEIQRGSDPRFNDLRSSALHRKYVGAPAASDVSASEGELFVRRLIRDTAERKHLLVEGARDVGESCDVLLLGNDGAVRALGGGKAKWKAKRTKKRKRPIGRK